MVRDEDYVTRTTGSFSEIELFFSAPNNFRWPFINVDLVEGV